MKRAGFTLIELLIVVAIIAILAAIAVPNFLEAQVRAKVSRAKNDMRSIATALESYRVDGSYYPEYAIMRLSNGDVEDPAVGFAMGYFEHLSRVPGLSITTPIAYITSIPPDPFVVKGGGSDDPRTLDYAYRNSRQTDRIFTGDRAAEPWLGPGGAFLLRDWGEWRLVSAGPNTVRNDIKSSIFYDPTNGTISNGDIVRSQKLPDSGRK